VKHTETESATTGQSFIACGTAFERLQRIINSCERAYHRARKELQTLHAAPAEPTGAPQPEETTTTSESPGSFCTNLENAATAALNSLPTRRRPSRSPYPQPPRPLPMRISKDSSRSEQFFRATHADCCPITHEPAQKWVLTRYLWRTHLCVPRPQLCERDMFNRFPS
jgi:hypothetical protein